VGTIVEMGGASIAVAKLDCAARSEGSRAATRTIKRPRFSTIVPNHLVVLGERYLLRAVCEYVAYYNQDRPHMSLDRDAPISRAVEPPDCGKILALPRVGGLHRRYARAT
jgi:hypothetical protein